MYCLRKSATLTHIYGPMYLELNDYPPYSDKKSFVFDTHIKINLIYLYGYTNFVEHNDLSNWVSKGSWEMLLSEFSQAEE